MIELKKDDNVLKKGTQDYGIGTVMKCDKTKTLALVDFTKPPEGILNPMWVHYSQLIKFKEV